MRPTIGITLGDVAGIGPEIILKALRKPKIYEVSKPVVIGDARRLQKALEIVGGWDQTIHPIQEITEARFVYGTVNCLDMRFLPGNLAFGKISPEAGNAAYHYIAKAVELAKIGEIDAICTAPLNKKALHMAGHIYPGHTEILADLTGTQDYAMMLSTDQLKVIHLTTHVGLIEAIEMITPERTYQVLKLAHETLRRTGKRQPHIAVCGINPHAGENGLFGNREEEEKLVPAIQKAVSEGMNASGPYPADTLFFRAMRGDFDIVVACYHDQGHVPVKVLGIEAGVNITVGLNGGIIRTSVDHGTAFDIAGKNIADERSMVAAILSAVEWAPNKTV